MFLSLCKNIYILNVCWSNKLLTSLIHSQYYIRSLLQLSIFLHLTRFQTLLHLNLLNYLFSSRLWYYRSLVRLKDNIDFVIILWWVSARLENDKTILTGCTNLASSKQDYYPWINNWKTVLLKKWLFVAVGKPIGISISMEPGSRWKRQIPNICRYDVDIVLFRPDRQNQSLSKNMESHQRLPGANWICYVKVLLWQQWQDMKKWQLYKALSDHNDSSRNTSPCVPRLWVEAVSKMVSRNVSPGPE